jgi:hypothetical protein
MRELSLADTVQCMPDRRGRKHGIDETGKAQRLLCYFAVNVGATLDAIRGFQRSCHMYVRHSSLMGTVGLDEEFCGGVCSEAKDHVSSSANIMSVLLCLFPCSVLL